MSTTSRRIFAPRLAAVLDAGLFQPQAGRCGSASTPLDILCLYLYRTRRFAVTYPTVMLYA